jgi:ATP-dependent exoDNAse (exonuclease V) beta subunit
MFELYPLPDIKDDFYFVKDYMSENALENTDKYITFIDDYIKKVYNFQAQSWSSLSKEHEVVIAFNRKPFTKHKELKPYIESIKRFDKFIDIFSHIDSDLESLFFDRIDKIQNLLHQIKSKYDSRLKELGKIDFDTIIAKTLEIIPKVKTNFRYIMVDEFQDTNATQFEIVKNSMNSDTNLFVVGDSKQSIYSFQGAEIEVFNDAVKNRKYFSSIEDMSQNYRSDEIIIYNVNKIFKELLKKNDNLKMISQNYEAHSQDLHTNRKGGSFKYLITSQPYQGDINELDTIVEFIAQIYQNKNSDYAHISELITKKKRAIAIIFDSSTKMIDLKQKLKAKGITAKVSASDNFYHTKEINDIFNVLKAIDILLQKEKKLENPSENIENIEEQEQWNASEKYYIAGALRSNILRVEDNLIKQYLENYTINEKLAHYMDIFKSMPLLNAVKYIYDDSNLQGVYAHFDDIEQRVANMYKFLDLCYEYQNSNEHSLYKFLSNLERSIYFSNAKEDEAFFQSDNTKSIEICSIHSTKGLAYPLVLLAHSDKGLYGQIQSDTLKHNNFTLNSSDVMASASSKSGAKVPVLSFEKKEIVGFKLENYSPLSLRVLKEIDKLKHIAEKKRLLYVALTRAEHDIVISAHLQQKKDNSISLREDSYLYMICNSLEINKDELFNQNEKYCLNLGDEKTKDVVKTDVEYVNHNFKPLIFKSKNSISATTQNKDIQIDKTSATLGTITHKIIELYWDKFKKNQESILDKMDLFDEIQREEIINHMNNFYKSDIFKILTDGTEHHFELEFNVGNKTGFIDFIYFDNKKNGWIIVDFKTGKETESKNRKYQQQLNFYQDVMSQLGYNIIETRLLWL